MEGPMATTKGMDRREFIVTTLTVGGGFALALTFLGSQAEAAVNTAKIPDKPWESLVGNGDTEINPWLVVAPDETVTIRVAQSDMGQQTYTASSRVICEEAEGDGSRFSA